MIWSAATAGKATRLSTLLSDLHGRKERECFWPKGDTASQNLVAIGAKRTSSKPDQSSSIYEHAPQVGFQISGCAILALA
jgi:hypothetical protein